MLTLKISLFINKGKFQAYLQSSDGVCLMQVSQRRLKFLPLWDVKTGTDLPAARLVKDKKILSAN